MTHIKTISLIPILFIIILGTQSCKKAQSDANCGCTSITSDELSDSDGTLLFMNNQYQQAWFIVVDFPNNAKWLCKICNTIDAAPLLNSINTTDTIPVKLSGKLKKFCPNETIGISVGIVVPYHIEINSLKRN